MVLFHVPDLPPANCAKPEHLELVDAAFARPGGPSGHQMRETLCLGCPAGQQCLDEAMTRGEQGVWGGTSPQLRARHGGAKPTIKRIPRGTDRISAKTGPTSSV